MTLAYLLFWKDDCLACRTVGWNTCVFDLLCVSKSVASAMRHQMNPQAECRFVETWHIARTLPTNRWQLCACCMRTNERTMAQGENVSTLKSLFVVGNPFGNKETLPTQLVGSLKLWNEKTTLAWYVSCLTTLTTQEPTTKCGCCGEAGQQIPPPEQTTGNNKFVQKS